jgi:hypothetical protein
MMRQFVAAMGKAEYYKLLGHLFEYLFETKTRK